MLSRQSHLLTDVAGQKPSSTAVKSGQEESINIARTWHPCPRRRALCLDHCRCLTILCFSDETRVWKVPSYAAEG